MKKQLNSAAAAGFVACFAMVIVGIATNGGIKTVLNFLHIPSMIVTFGGAVFAVMITSDSFGDFSKCVRSFIGTFRKNEGNLEDVCTSIFAMSQLARKEGLLALEAELDRLDDEFMKKGLKLTVDGTEPELIKGILETELLHQMEDNDKIIQFWQDLGAYAPAWGMVGTLLGLINMLKAMGTDTGAVGEGMSLALLTTLYGSLLANWVCIPVARKLKKNSAAKELRMELIIEGVLSIQAGENPMLIKEKIRTFQENWEENNAA